MLRLIRIRKTIIEVDTNNKTNPNTITKTNTRHSTKNKPNFHMYTNTNNKANMCTDVHDKSNKNNSANHTNTMNKIDCKYGYSH